MNIEATIVEPEEYEALKQQLEQPKSQVSLTSYDLNQQLINEYAVLQPAEIKQKTHYVTEWLLKNKDNYYMMLNHDDHFYTLFHATSTYTMAKEFINYLCDCFVNIKLIEIDPSNGVLSVWGKFVGEHIGEIVDDSFPQIYYLFPYSEGVIEA